jgi:uncharacterized MAPEG superfamily protein
VTIPLWCLLIAVLLPNVLAGIGGYYRSRLPGGLDNNNPREQAKALTGAGARAYAAQQNAWEALATFTVAVLTAHVLGADPAMSARLAIGWVAFRVLHSVCYLADWGAARSLMHVGAVVCAVWLFLLGA